MGMLAPLAALLGIEVDALVDKARRQAVVYTLVALFGIIAIAFLLVALFLWLSDVWSPLVASLAIAGGAIVLALIVYLIGRLTANSRKVRETERRRSSETTALMTTAALTALPMVLRSPVARTVGLPLAAAVAAAFFGKAVKDKHDDETP